MKPVCGIRTSTPITSWWTARAGYGSSISTGASAAAVTRPGSRRTWRGSNALCTNRLLPRPSSPRVGRRYWMGTRPGLSMEALRSKPWSSCMRIVSVLSLAALSMLAGCGHSNPPPAVPAPVSAPAAVTASPTAATQPAPAAASTPPPTTVAAAASVAAPAAASAAGPESAGSVALAQGSVTDQATDGTSRQLKDGDAVYPGDDFTLGDDSYLDLDLEDGGRILLRPDTSFQIQEYHFDPDAHPAAGEQPLLATSQQKPESAFFKLVKGGLRAVDGLIGQSEPKNYGVETPVATIGVRGTAFDVR